MNPEASTTDELVEDPQKAQHMAILEGHMREQAKGLEAKAAAYQTDFEETGDAMKERAALGAKQHTEDYKASIDTMTDLVGTQYEDMTKVVEDIRNVPEGPESEHVKTHRTEKEARLHSAMTKYGLIGSASELYKHTTYNFERDDDIRIAAGHAQQAQFGLKKVS